MYVAVIFLVLDAPRFSTLYIKNIGISAEPFQDIKMYRFVVYKHHLYSNQNIGEVWCL